MSLPGYMFCLYARQVRIQRGGGGGGGGQGVRIPPGKSQVIWVSIGNKQFPPPPLEKVGPPPPLENVGPPPEKQTKQKKKGQSFFLPD